MAKITRIKASDGPRKKEAHESRQVTALVKKRRRTSRQLLAKKLLSKTKNPKKPKGKIKKLLRKR